MQRNLNALAVAGLMLAQVNTGASYNGGIPLVPGTRVPESNPTIPGPVPFTPAPSSPVGPASPGTASAPSTSSQGPAYSFGAAPAPIVSPNR